MAALLTSNVPTLLDLNQATDPNGQAATPIQMLAQTNDIIPDIYWEEGNLPTGHRTTVWTTLPTVSSRLLNAGVTPGKGTNDQFTDSCAIFESYTVVDKKLADLAPNPATYRMQQRAMMIEAFGQKFTNILFNGNAVATPSDFTGLMPRYNDTDGGTAASIIDAAGSGSDNASIWLIGWGPQGIACIYPRGGQAGLRVEDKGEQLWQTSTTLGGSTSAMRAYVEWFEWTAGLSVRDWRCAIRIANIDVSDALTLATTQTATAATNMITEMIKAYYKLPSNKSGLRLGYYCNRSIAFALHNMALSKASSQVTVETIDGKPVTMFLGIPVRTVDQLGIAEARVTSSTVSL